MLDFINPVLRNRILLSHLIFCSFCFPQLPKSVNRTDCGHFFSFALETIVVSTSVLLVDGTEELRVPGRYTMARPALLLHCIMQPHSSELTIHSTLAHYLA